MKTNVIKEGFKEAKNKLVIVSLPLSFFALISIACLVLGFFVPFTLILTIPFLVIPSFFSLSAINTIASNQNAHEGLGFFIFFRAYFSPVFKGGYRVIVGILKAIAGFFIVSIILSMILCPTILYKDPGYISLMEQIKGLTDNNQINELLLNFINTNPVFNRIVLIVNSASSFVSFCILILHFSTNAFKYNYNFMSKIPLPMPDLVQIDRKVRKENRKEFCFDYLKTYWFVFIILVIGYAGAFVVSLFFINNIDMIQLNVISIFGSFILLLFFIPYFLNANQILFNKYRLRYVDALIDLSKQSIEQLKKTQNISEEKEKEVIKILESEKDNIKKDIKKDD